jgi:hypothetical protein
MHMRPITNHHGIGISTRIPAAEGRHPVSATDYPNLNHNKPHQLDIKVPSLQAYIAFPQQQ